MGDRKMRGWRAELLGTLIGIIAFTAVAQAFPALPADELIQPVQAYLLPLRGLEGTPPEYGSPLRDFTHIASEYGTMGPGEKRLSWTRGEVHADLKDAGEGAWAGAWHSLNGAAADDGATLDFARCYPALVRDEYQPRCVGIWVRVKGQGKLKLEVKASRANDERILWTAAHTVNWADGFRDLIADCDPGTVGNAKFLSWVAEPGSDLRIAGVGLVLKFPPMPFEKWCVLASYAKFARCYSPIAGAVKDQAQLPAGQNDAVPASGLFCLATTTAWRMGFVDREFAQDTLRKVHRTISSLPRGKGLLPHFIRLEGGAYRPCPGTEYSTIDTSLYYHGMVLAAQMLGDTDTLGQLAAEIKGIDFAYLTDAAGHINMGLKSDGTTLLDCKWDIWGGESALALLLDRMARVNAAPMKMDGGGQVFNGVGFIAEIQSLFYSQFSDDRPDAVTHVNWRDARGKLLDEQMAYLPRDTEAAKLGIYGLSAGEGLQGLVYVADGTRSQPRTNLVHPHYMLMSGCLRPDPQDVYRSLKAMQERGLFPPWGLIENVTADLGEYLPFIGSLNASFETLGAYHLWAKATRQPDEVYVAARKCPPMAAAIKAFYP